MDRRNGLKIGTAAAVLLLAGGGAAARTAASSAGSAHKMRARAPYLWRPDGTMLFYKEWGAGESMLFLHCAGASSEMWNYQMPALARQGLRCIAYDRRGHGRSSIPGAGYDFDTLADDLAGVIDALDLTGLTLVGHSMGCGEIVRYLSRHGARRVARIALLAPTLPFLLKTPDHPEGIERALFESIRAQWLRDYPKWLIENTPPFFAPDTSPQMLQWGIQLGLSTSLHAALECNIAVTETDFRAELARITVPTLVVHGTKDVSAPLAMTGERTARQIPGARLEVYEGAPHGLPITHATRLNADLMRWIRA